MPLSQEYKAKYYESLKDERSRFTRSANRWGVAAIGSASVFAADVMVAATESSSLLDTTAGRVGAVIIGVISGGVAVGSAISSIADFQFAATNEAAIKTIAFENHPDTLVPQTDR